MPDSPVPDHPMTEVIAEREYHFVHDGGREVIHVQVGKPAPTRDTPDQAWYCPWTIRRGSNTNYHAAFGVDSLQALMLGLSVVRTDLLRIAAKGKLTTSDGYEGPCMELVG